MFRFQRRWMPIINIIFGLGIICLSMTSTAARSEINQIPAKKSDNVEIRGILLPNYFNGFAIREVIENETSHPGLGTTVKFDRAQGYSTTVYIYNAQIKQIPNGAKSDVLQDHFDQITREVFAAKEILGLSDIRLIDRYGIGSPALGVTFLCAEFVLAKPDGSIRRSYAYLSAKNGNFIKIRMTSRENDPTDSTSRNFVNKIAALNGI